MENNNGMHSHLDEVTGAIFGVFVYLLSYACKFPMLQIHAHPITSEIIIDSIRLFFSVSAAGIGYLLIHWLKKNVTHEIKDKPKKKNENSSI